MIFGMIGKNLTSWKTILVTNNITTTERMAATDPLRNIQMYLNL